MDAWWMSRWNVIGSAVDEIGWSAPPCCNEICVYSTGKLTAFCSKGVEWLGSHLFDVFVRGRGERRYDEESVGGNRLIHLVPVDSFTTSIHTYFISSGVLAGLLRGRHQFLLSSTQLHRATSDQACREGKRAIVDQGTQSISTDSLWCAGSESVLPVEWRAFAVYFIASLVYRC